MMGAEYYNKVARSVIRDHLVNLLPNELDWFFAGFREDISIYKKRWFARSQFPCISLDHTSGEYRVAFADFEYLPHAELLVVKLNAELAQLRSHWKDG